MKVKRMNPTLPFIQTLSKTFGQTLSTSDETQTYSLKVDGEDIFLRYLPEENAWLYFGFVTDFMRSVTPEQLEKALELNLFGRGTANFHLGLVAKAIALSGSLPLDNAEPDRLVEALMQLAQHLTPIHQILNHIEEETFTDETSYEDDDEPLLDESDLEISPSATPHPTGNTSPDPFSFLKNDLLQV